jgi:hypothetical protein
LVTNGTSELPQNNQPVRFGRVTMIHNGIVVNVDRLWSENSQLSRSAEVDTEVMAAIVDASMAVDGDPMEATRDVFSSIKGAASVAWVHDQFDHLVLATNTGDLYYCFDQEMGISVFASERYILERSLNDLDLKRTLEVKWLAPNSGLIVDTETLSTNLFSLKTPSVAASHGRATPLARLFHQENLTPMRSAPLVARSENKPNERLLRYSEASLRQLKRCSRCILPVTFPFIEFDEQGVCNYCRSYQPRYKDIDAQKAKDDFFKLIESYRSNNGGPDVLVPFSGGRDSSYGLHIIKNEFRFTPITFTYDWGMVTDLARRNVARMCGHLGVQNILVSANIKQKRDKIRMNVAAWLKKPDLGMVPLFMAGDKHFFSIVNQLKKQTGIRLDLWSANPLENTDFKSGFCGVPPDFEKHRLDYLSFSRKIRMALYYAGRFAMNPGYLNSSLLDTMGAFSAYYFEPRKDFFFMFNHLVWNESEVNSLLLNEYDWELATDTRSTWRIGDGTAPFYNYIYATARGFSEFDTFRSNQVREGQIDRALALESVLEENRPRAESLAWYLSTIGLDFDVTIEKINALDSLGLHR